MPTMPTIREAREGDLCAITTIYADSVVNGVASYELTPPDEAEMRTRFSAIVERGYPYIVADEDGRVVGYAYASAFRTRPAYRWLVENSIYLAPDARGRGLGRLLLDTLLGRCRDLGFRQMLAVIGGGHPASIALHRAAGFAESGRIAASGYKHGRWLDTVIMQIALGEGASSEPDPREYPGTLFKEA